MLMLIAVCDVRLADPPQSAVSIDFGKHADLQSPIPRDAVDPGKIPDHRELPCERVPEAIEEGEQCLRAHDVLQASDQRGKEEPGHAAVQSVCHTAVVCFAEFIAEIRIGDRKAQPRQVLTIVTQDVAIMKRNDLTLSTRQDIAKAEPAAPSLSRLTSIDSLGRK